jgi:hypothetical protein
LFALRQVPEPSGTFIMLPQVSPLPQAMPAMPPHISPSLAGTRTAGGDSVLGVAEGGVTTGALDEAAGEALGAGSTGDVDEAVLDAAVGVTTGASAGLSQAQSERMPDDTAKKRATEGAA